MMHATNIQMLRIQYFNELQLGDLCQLQEELNTLWKIGQSPISSNLYDKITDSIDYEMTRLKADPYDYAVKKTDTELKKLLDYATKAHAQGTPLMENALWDVLHQELTLRSVINMNSKPSYPSHWTAMSLDESPVQFISVSRTSQEFQDLSNYFSKSLGKTPIVIYSLIRIQNLRLWSIFQDLQKTLPNGSRRLIHGTTSSAQQKLVMYHGFHHSFCPGGLIGDGVYFAVNADYSNCDPYVLKRTNHRRELFICQVLLGTPGQGQYGLKSPTQGCHSVFHLNNDQNDQYCIFNSYQAYPEYIVQYDYE